MDKAVRPLADDYVSVYQSPHPDTVYCYSPGITRLSTGRLVVTMDLGGPGLKQMPGAKGQRHDGGMWQGKVFTSDDRGRTWTHRADFPCMHARPFCSGSSVYILGHMGDLAILRSDDGGETWTEPAVLTKDEHWHQAPCNVHYHRGCVYLVMERRCYLDMQGWPVSVLAPVLLRGTLQADLTKRENWTFASELVFRDAVSTDDLDHFGVPFYTTPERAQAAAAPGRECAPLGWLESNVVQFLDRDHYLYDPEERTYHLWMRAHTGGTGYAAIAKVRELDDGSMVTELETVPSGRKLVYVPCPGGQMKFHILYDEVTGLYWLLSTQATDSMTRADRLAPNRYNLPNNERQRLQLHFSRNCIDWCFAGLVASGGDQGQSRHYASMVIDGDDLQVVSRSGDVHALDAHQTNLISFHTVKSFRSLVY